MTINTMVWYNLRKDHGCCVRVDLVKLCDDKFVGSGTTEIKAVYLK